MHCLVFIWWVLIEAFAAAGFGSFVEDALRLGGPRKREEEEECVQWPEPESVLRPRAARSRVVISQTRCRSRIGALASIDVAEVGCLA